GADVRAAHQGALDAAVLVAERDLEVEDVLAVALEAEVAGLDDAGVHGTDGDLVHLLALDAVEVGDADGGARVAHRLEPRVALGDDLAEGVEREARQGVARGGAAVVEDEEVFAQGLASRKAAASRTSASTGRGT